jgi:lipopolysaccharide/colanic/teichoic acid biosynthesis glycosyltransferase
MSELTDDTCNQRPDEERIFKLGLIMRKLSLDEIPQLLNVIKGDMSIVGPRPLIVSYLKLYSYLQKKRHNVKPGITGWEQVNGRNAIIWEKKFQSDNYYVYNVSFSLDFKILLLTVIKVLKSEGINSKGNVSSELFNGKN